MPMIGFNGALHEPLTRWQLLGNGRRAFNPVLMRFHSPDRLSPFGRGGINAYAYCAGDPINLADPNGRFAVPLMMMGLALVGGVGEVVGFATVDSSGGGGNDSGVNPWIIGGVIAAAGMLAGVGMAGRKKWKTLDLGASSNDSINLPRRPGDRSSGIETPVHSAQIDRNGDVLVEMKDLPSAVRTRIENIRDHGPHSKHPDSKIVGNGKFIEDLEGPFAYAKGDPYFRRFNIVDGSQVATEFGAWRIVTGSTKTSGIGVVFGTSDHGKTRFRVPDWRADHREDYVRRGR